jgi:hypothetical protein
VNEAPGTSNSVLLVEDDPLVVHALALSLR